MSNYLTFSGSSRAASFNTRTVHVIADWLAAMGGEVTRADLGNLSIPIYDGDLEARSGLPAGVQELKTGIEANDGVVIGCPEYNGHVTPLLLNALNWATRSENASPDLARFRELPVLICCASPGRSGGSRAAAHLRGFLSGIGCLVFPDVFSVPAAGAAFDDAGALIDERLATQAEHVAERFNDFVRRNR